MLQWLSDWDSGWPTTKTRVRIPLRPWRHREFSSDTLSRISRKLARMRQMRIYIVNDSKWNRHTLARIGRALARQNEASGSAPVIIVEANRKIMQFLKGRAAFEAYQRFAENDIMEWKRKKLEKHSERTYNCKVELQLEPTTFSYLISSVR